MLEAEDCLLLILSEATLHAKPEERTLMRNTGREYIYFLTANRLLYGMT